MRILVVGGTSFMGPHVVRRLDELGHEVLVYHRGRTRTELPSRVRRILDDRSAIESHRDEIRSFAPEVAVDMILRTEQDARQLLAIARGVARRTVAISSVDVFQAFGVVNGTEDADPSDEAITEDSPLRSRLYPYRGTEPRAADDPRRWMDDYDKILVERIVLGEAPMPGTVLRLPMVYGPNDGQHRLRPWLRPMDEGREEVRLPTAQARWRGCRGFVENIADAIVLSTVDDRAAGRVYVVAEPDNLAEAAWVEAIGGAAGWRGRVVEVPEEALTAEERTESRSFRQHLAVDSSRIRRELGYAERVPSLKALVRTVAWERASP